jgi:MFS transporter, DHA1 family, multidrug resistance protein
LASTAIITPSLASLLLQQQQSTSLALYSTSTNNNNSNNNNNSSSNNNNSHNSSNNDSNGNIAGTTALSTNKDDDNNNNNDTAIAEDDKVDPRVWAITVSSFLMGCAIGVMFPLMPIFGRDLGFTTAQYGIVSSSIGLARLLCNIPAAWLAERYGRRPLLIGGPAIASLGIMLHSFATNAPELAAFRAITGAGGSLQMTGGQLFLADISRTSNRARTMAFMSVAFSAGTALGPLAGGLLASHFGLRLPFYFVGGAVAAVTVINYFVVPETKVFAAPPSNSDTTQPPASPPPWETFVDSIRQWKPLLRNRQMQSVLGLQTAFWIATSGATFTLMPLFATNKFGFEPNDLGYCFALMSVITLVTMRPIARFTDLYGRKAVIVPGALLMATSLALYPWISSPAEFLGLVSLSSVGGTMVSSAPAAFVTEITTPETRAQGLALLRTASDLGFLIGAAFLGVLAISSSIEAALGAASGIIAVSALVFSLRAVETVKRKCIGGKADAAQSKPLSETPSKSDNDNDEHGDGSCSSSTKPKDSF